MKKIIIPILVIIAGCGFNEKKSISTVPASGIAPKITGNPIEKEHYSSVELSELNPANTTKVFSINTNNDTIIKGEKGVQIHIPKNAFNTTHELVNVHLEEYISISDIVAKRLITQSDGKLLKSKGMVNVQAFAGNKEISLKKGKSISILFPSSKSDNEEYQLFEGQKTANNNINWLPRTNFSNATNTFTLVENYSVAAQMTHTPVFSLTAYDTLSKYLIVPELKYKKNYYGMVNVKLLINEFGEVENTWLTQPIHKDIDNLILNTISKIEDWCPAIYGNTPLRTYYSMRFLVQINYQKSKIFIPNKLKIKREYQDICKNAITITQEYTAKHNAEKQRKSDFNNLLAGGNSSEITPNYSSEEVKGYVLQSTKLGWINCDRFYNLPESAKTNIYVKLKDEADKQVVMALIGKNKSLIQPNEINMKDSLIIFKGVPKDEIKVVINTKKSGEKVLFALNTINNTTENRLNYENLTYAEIGKKLKSIE